MRRFKLRPTLIIDRHNMDPYSPDTVYAQELLARINYINCLGRPKVTYIPIATETDDYLVYMGIFKYSDIIEYLKQIFLAERVTTKNRRLFDKAHKVINN